MKKKLTCVLLVDDNESDNFFHKRVIEQSGITDLICIALNGQEAIDFLPALVFPNAFILSPHRKEHWHLRSTT